MKFYFDKEQLERIKKEYLGLDTEYLKMINEKQLEKDILTTIDKYKNDTRKVEYILESDLRYAYDNEEDIRVLENINGIIVYENLL